MPDKFSKNDGFVKGLKKGAWAFLTGLMLSLPFVPSRAQIDIGRTVVTLNPGVYDGLSMENDTTYRGNLPAKVLSDAKSGLLLQTNASSALEFLDKSVDFSKYTVISGDISWGNNSSLENCVLKDLPYSLPNLGEGGSFENNLAIGEATHNGLESDFTDSDIKGNVIVNFKYCIQLNADAQGDRANITENFLGWCAESAIICNYSANIGDERTHGNNIFFRNQEYNLRITNYTVPTKSEMQVWYTRDGVFLDRRGDILNTCFLDFNPSAASLLRVGVEAGGDSKSDYIDVVPFHTQEPYLIERALGVKNWEGFDVPENYFLDNSNTRND